MPGRELRRRACGLRCYGEPCRCQGQRVPHSRARRRCAAAARRPARRPGEEHQSGAANFLPGGTRRAVDRRRGGPPRGDIGVLGPSAIGRHQPAAGGFNWDRSWRIASTRTLEASPRRSGKAGAPLEERPRGWYRSSAAQFKAHGGRGCCSCGEASVSTRWVAIIGGKAAPSFSQPMEVWSRPGGGAPLRV